VPADDGLGFHEQHDVHEAVEVAGQGTDESAIESAQARTFDLASDDDELLAKDQVLGDQGCAGRDEGQDGVEPEAKEGDHGSARATMLCSWHGGVGVWQGGPCGEGADLAPLWPRHVGETGADPPHDGVFAPTSQPDVGEQESRGRRQVSHAPRFSATPRPKSTLADTFG
jgi:hypothetical protein